MTKFIPKSYHAAEWVTNVIIAGRIKNTGTVAKIGKKQAL